MKSLWLPYHTIHDQGPKDREVRIRLADGRYGMARYDEERGLWGYGIPVNGVKSEMVTYPTAWEARIA